MYNVTTNFPSVTFLNFVVFRIYATLKLAPRWILFSKNQWAVPIDVIYCELWWLSWLGSTTSHIKAFYLYRKHGRELFLEKTNNTRICFFLYIFWIWRQNELSRYVYNVFRTGCQQLHHIRTWRYVLLHFVFLYFVIKMFWIFSCLCVTIFTRAFLWFVLHLNHLT